jgi:hypothetical protein
MGAPSMRIKGLLRSQDNTWHCGLKRLEMTGAGSIMPSSQHCETITEGSRLGQSLGRLHLPQFQGILQLRMTQMKLIER